MMVQVCFKLLLLLSAFSFSQGWPQHIIILHIFLSSMFVSFAPTSSISSFTISKNLLFGLPLFLFPGNSISIIFLHTLCLSKYVLNCNHMNPNHGTFNLSIALLINVFDNLCCCKERHWMDFCTQV